MEFKNLSSTLVKMQHSISKEIMQKIIYIAVNFSIGLLCTRGIVFGKYSPFAIAYIAAVPRKFLWSSVLGSLFGYLLPSAVYMPFRYLASILTVVAIRWTLSELTKVNTNQFFAPIVAFIPLLATGITMSFINQSVPTVAALYVAEAFLAGGSSFFFSRTLRIVTEKRYRGKLDNIDIACLSASIAIIILSLTEIELFSISIGRICMVILILTCSGCGGIAGGTISGVIGGTISGLSNFGLSYLSGAYGLGGLMSGIFASYSKIFSTLAFIVAHGVASLQISDTTNLFDNAIEVAIASVIYMILPQSRKITELFSLKKDNLSGNSLRNNLVMRLNHSSNALSVVSERVKEISEKLIKSTGISMSNVYNNACGEICAGCSMKAVCWDKNKENSIRALSSLTPILKEKSAITTDDFNDYFKKSCSRVGEMKESVNKYYKMYLSRKKAEVRSENIQDISSEQFKVTSAMLTDMASEISLYESFDEQASERIYEVFRKMDIYPIEICCRRDRYNRITVEAEIEKSKDQKLNKGQLVRDVSRACGKSFSPPCISNTEYTYKIQMCQKPLLDVAIGMAQHSASKLCGDSAVTFYDGQGNYIAIISDGMGTGGLAAIDGTMASSIMESLIKAGMGYDTALKLVNSALMSKSDDESLATIDIATLDLFTGKCEFRKAGSPFTIVKKGKKVYTIEENSLPVGIMNDVHFSLSVDNFKKNDIICLLSDGATTCGLNWIEETVLNYHDSDPNKLASEIVSYAKKTRADGHTDDITALVIIVTDNI